MNAKFLIDLLSTLPTDTIIQISFYDEAYDDERIVAVKAASFTEEWKCLDDDMKPKVSQPNRLVLS